jgi:RNA polymerase sigma-70 factor (ECF subfamily)
VCPGLSVASVGDDLLLPPGAQASLDDGVPMTDTATPRTVVQPPADPLADLVARAAAGDVTALADVYDATSARVHGLALHVLGDADLACEVVQETYAEVARSSRPFDHRTGTANAWIVATAHRHAVARRRALTSVPTAGVPAPVADLPEPERQVVQLAYLEGRTCAEVARITRVSPEAAAVRLRSALLSLRSRSHGDGRVA